MSLIKLSAFQSYTPQEIFTLPVPREEIPHQEKERPEVERKRKNKHVGFQPGAEELFEGVLRGKTATKRANIFLSEIFGGKWR